MIDLTNIIGKTIASIKPSKSGASMLIVFTDGSEVEFVAQANGKYAPTINVLES